MFQINQCVHVPLGASGSSTINTNECAAGETPFQLSAGDKSAPVHVYFLGISLPFANAVAFLSKNFSIMEGLKLQMRMEAFNVLNHPLWAEQPDNSTNDTTFGMIQRGPSGQSNMPRQMQLSAKVVW
jgi:hypothetical protein